MDEKDALKALVREKALRLGEFTLASGKKSSYYLDCRNVTLDSMGARLVGQAMLDMLGTDLPDAVGGMAIGADPITGAMITLAGLSDIPLKGFIVRKEAKDHGTQSFVEGPVEPGDRAVIVEDVVTSGGSCLAAIERCEQFGLKIERVLAIIDRLEGGAENLKSQGYELTSLLTIRDFGIQP